MSAGNTPSLRRISSRTTSIDASEESNAIRSRVVGTLSAISLGATSRRLSSMSNTSCQLPAASACPKTPPTSRSSALNPVAMPRTCSMFSCIERRSRSRMASCCASLDARPPAPAAVPANHASRQRSVMRWASLACASARRTSAANCSAFSRTPGNANTASALGCNPGTAMPGTTAASRSAVEGRKGNSPSATSWLVTSASASGAGRMSASASASSSKTDGIPSVSATPRASKSRSMRGRACTAANAAKL